MACISVAIPLFNKEYTIKKTIWSVLNQQIKNFELIIVDDGSTDRSYEIVSQIEDKRIRLIRQENAGVSAARNRAVQDAHTDLVAFLDGDDEWKPWFLETILRLSQKYPNAGAYATAYERVDADGHHVKPKYTGIPPPPYEGIIPNYFFAALFVLPVWSSAVAVPTKVLREIGGFPVGVVLGEDQYVWGKIALKYPIAFSTQYSAIYHREVMNRACDAGYRENSAFADFAIRALANREVRKDLIPSLKEYIAREYIDIASNCLFNFKKPDVARKNLKSIQYTKIFWKKKYYLYFLSLMPNTITQTVLRIRLAFLRK